MLVRALPCPVFIMLAPRSRSSTHSAAAAFAVLFYCLGLLAINNHVPSRCPPASAHTAEFVRRLIKKVRSPRTSSSSCRFVEFDFTEDVSLCRRRPRVEFAGGGGSLAVMFPHSGNECITSSLWCPSKPGARIVCVRFVCRTNYLQSTSVKSNSDNLTRNTSITFFSHCSFSTWVIVRPSIRSDWPSHKVSKILPHTTYIKREHRKHTRQAPAKLIFGDVNWLFRLPVSACRRTEHEINTGKVCSDIRTCIPKKRCWSYPLRYYSVGKLCKCRWMWRVSTCMRVWCDTISLRQGAKLFAIFCVRSGAV